MLLSITNRQKYMKYLGLYDGEIDGLEGPLTRNGYKELQNTYFIREKDKDGLYGNNTDILLRNAYAVKKNTTNFTVSEFRCGCGGKYCTGYPVILNTQLLKNIQSIRTKFGSTVISSSVRCKKYNNSLAGSSSVSYHMEGCAIDFYGTYTREYPNRQKVMEYWKKLPKAGYTYCNTPRNQYPNMGIAIHVQVSK